MASIADGHRSMLGVWEVHLVHLITRATFDAYGLIPDSIFRIARPLTSGSLGLCAISPL